MLVVRVDNRKGRRAARGLVELGRHHAAGQARAARAASSCDDVGVLPDVAARAR